MPLTFAPSMGVNLGEINDWSTEQPFLNIFKTSREPHAGTFTQWETMTPAELRDSGYLDSDGWLTQMPPGTDRVLYSFFTELADDFTSISGRYILRYQGEGTLVLTGSLSIVSQQPNEIVFDYTPSVVSTSIISIEGTNPANPIRNIEIVKEEYISLYDGGEIFNPIWVDLMRDWRCFRFLLWMRSNDSAQVDWADRPLESNATWATPKGVPLTVLVRLCNYLGADPWFNIPFLASNDYITQFATYVRDNLDTRLKAYFELSNEVWNWAFSQATEANNAGLALWGTTYGNWPQQVFFGYRSAQMAQIVKDTFAQTEDPAERVRNVLGGFIANPGGQYPDVKTGVQLHVDDGGEGLSLFDNVTVTWYFGGNLGHDDNYATLQSWLALGHAQALDNVFQQLTDGSLIPGDPWASTEAIIDHINIWAGLAATDGLKLTAYEGGSHIVASGANNADQVLTDFFIDVHADSRMAPVYQTVLDAWDAAGGDLPVLFNNISRHTRHGSWGHLRHLSDASARWDVCKAYNETHNPNLEVRALSDFDGTIEGNEMPDTITVTSIDAIRSTPNAPSATAVIEADNTITIDPGDPDYTGLIEVDYTVTDAETPPNTASATIFATFSGSPPVANDDTVTGPKGSTINLDPKLNDTAD